MMLLSLRDCLKVGVAWAGSGVWLGQYARLHRVDPFSDSWFVAAS
ncbi:MAG: hypothetical protein JWM12_966 [Ilumatobacteraceae bacterium]|nr:hypothetical protein [Ilumatobacteraceae bacterium]